MSNSTKGEGLLIHIFLLGSVFLRPYSFGGLRLVVVFLIVLKKSNEWKCIPYQTPLNLKKKKSTKFDPRRISNYLS